MSAPADRDLVNRVRQGEVNAYGELVQRYQQSVFNVCYRVLQNRQDAEDLAQESFVRGFNRLDQFDINRPFGPWIHRLAANLSINALKRRKQLLTIDEERDRSLIEDNTQPEQAFVRKEHRSDIHAALADLPPHYRAALELRHYQNMKYEEMAEALGLPLNTVKSHLFRARKMLAERLRKDR